MNLKELKVNFIHSISEIYPSEEVHSFFNLLVEKYIGFTRIDIALYPEKIVSGKNEKIFADAIQRLQQYEPIQYIIGETAFFGLTFKVDNKVLIPRPETEELVAWIISETQNKEATILDIGTGSGCIAIALANKMSKATINAIDISKNALAIAKQNALANKVAINFLEVDILQFEKNEEIQVYLETKFDIIVSNPPYVRASEKELIQANVLKHEPSLALFVEDIDPLLFYWKIAQFSQKYLKENGSLFFEINEYLSEDLCKMLILEGFRDVTIRKDIFGKDRMVKCKKDEKTK